MHEENKEIAKIADVIAQECKEPLTDYLNLLIQQQVAILENKNTRGASDFSHSFFEFFLPEALFFILIDAEKIKENQSIIEGLLRFAQNFPKLADKASICSFYQNLLIFITYNFDKKENSPSRIFNELIAILRENLYLTAERKRDILVILGNKAQSYYGQTREIVWGKRAFHFFELAISAGWGMENQQLEFKSYRALISTYIIGFEDELGIEQFKKEISHLEDKYGSLVVRPTAQDTAYSLLEWKISWKKRKDLTIIYNINSAHFNDPMQKGELILIQCKIGFYLYEKSNKNGESLKNEEDNSDFWQKTAEKIKKENLIALPHIGNEFKIWELLCKLNLNRKRDKNLEYELQEYKNQLINYDLYYHDRQIYLRAIKKTMTKVMELESVFIRKKKRPLSSKPFIFS